MTTWFTADTHFGHENLINYGIRPFISKEDMNEKLVANWNNNIADEDDVYVIGDFCFMDKDSGQAVLDRLKGRKHLVLGNHDKIGRQLTGWKWVKEYHEMTIEGKHIVLCHYAMRVWNRSHYGSWMLYGHSHGTLPDDPNLLSFDVGVDCHNYTPINMDSVKRIMEKKTWKPPYQGSNTQSGRMSSKGSANY